MTNNGDEQEPRIAQRERHDELDRTGTERVLDLMDRRVAHWQERLNSLKRDHEEEYATKQREYTAIQREYTAIQREIDEFRDELRSIRDERRRREDWIR